MPHLLVSFIGKGSRQSREGEGGRPGYRLAEYRFPEEDGRPSSSERTSLFAGALLRRLDSLGRRPDRWLVLGTARSNWDNLENALAEPALEKFLETHNELSDRIRNVVDSGKATDENLAPWARALTDALNMPVHLRVVGLCDTPESESALWAALRDHVKDGDQVTVDITHGLRHMPLITVCMTLLLRRLHAPSRVIFYYGAHDLAPPGGSSPVFRVDLPHRLIEVAEAISVEQHTGSLLALSEVLPRNLRQPAEKVAFSLGIGRLGSEAVQELRTRVKKTHPANPAEEAAVLHLERSLPSPAAGSGYQRLVQAGERHLEHGQHLLCAIFLHEAVNALALQQFPADQVNWEARLKASRDRLMDKADPADRKAIEILRRLRNVLVHGPNADDKEIERLLAERKVLEEELARALDAVRNLIQKIEGGAP